MPGHTQLDADHVKAQKDILKYIISIGSSLRLQMDVGTLLTQVAEATCEALRFRYCALYLSDNIGSFRMQAVVGTRPEQEKYLKEHPLPEKIVRQLTNELYRISNSYFVPQEAPAWQDQGLNSFFVVGDDYEPVESSNLSPEELKNSQRWCPHDLLIIPLLSVDNTLLGFLTPDAPLNGLRPTPETIELLELFANQAAVAIEGARLYEEARRSSEERAALLEIGRILCAPDALKDINAAYSTMYEQIKNLMPIDCFLVYRREQDGLNLAYLVDEGILYTPQTSSLILPWRQAIIAKQRSEYIFSTGEEYRAFARAYGVIVDNQLLGSMRPTESLLFVPILYGEEVIGTISVQSYQPYVYHKRHAEILKEIGVQAGLAITNALLYADLRKAVKQAQESEELKNNFLMTASHELRTPLTAIQGYLELLNIQGAMLDEEKRRHFITNAYRACDELVLLLGNMMDASNIDQAWVTLKLSTVSVSSAVQQILEILEPTITRQKRVVNVHTSENMYAWVDDLRLRQVLLNIVGNALKYTPAQAEIVIGAERISREGMRQLLAPLPGQNNTLPAEHYIIIAVQDRGPGIAAEDQAQLFSKFMRLPGSHNSEQRGAGWGLYLCRRLVTAMDGYIWVESKGIPNEGSTFYIALPQSLPR
ncbi:GAF domain-containing protein [Ktedonosporobacter rubrisoli]|uniref:histidine kinase n=1 Tax=Ktedonosporobacter rubrisoli TaxID=2509675 RepID=A0A4P6K281_KTERU|nr:ATP-binding protein [Ktedonosporobacter rubrisoli]QBD82308.1 GAF domain-containing protein [Ktedonosporobacter rubrisoli]